MKVVAAFSLSSEMVNVLDEVKRYGVSRSAYVEQVLRDNQMEFLERAKRITGMSMAKLDHPSPTLRRAVSRASVMAQQLLIVVDRMRNKQKLTRPEAIAFIDRAEELAAIIRNHELQDCQVGRLSDTVNTWVPEAQKVLGSDD